ncbi:WD40 repeat domain-containing protein [Tenacibaculum discolor]|uniref:WD40 repeat domain-containing protein n=1 Tax=Tenacibaculum discolor TaxID=361581 RepID=A0A2G1BWF2_9FLAO|nr:WD40 repeat domain-containing protein [Tenacibaculum discolor]MDP2540400.1 WD40 repeat domain-containing protein [Tenacibaculum discolor]PHN98363.1 hypothetical protein CSC81_02425 [Tenacibaculum discolor]PHO00815.1 hypothetical protein CSC82_26845 [Rhodobacteraceae bacterium 4F10]
MKKRKIILLLVVLSITYFVYVQLFKQPKLFEGNLIELKNTFKHHSGDVWEVKFAPNDTLMVSGGIDQNTKIWNRITGEVVHNLPHKIGSPSVDFNPNGKLVATGAYDGLVRLWDVNSGVLLKVLDGNKGTIWSISFSPDGNLIAAGGDDNKVTVWNVNTGKVTNEFKEASHNIWEVVFNPTGDHLAASSSDNTIRIYDIKSGRLSKTILGHSLVPLSMDFSPNGKFLASAGDDKTIKIWDTNKWELLHTLQGENEAIHSVVFIGNNRILAGGTDKKMLGELLEYHFGFTGYTKPIVATLWDINDEKILQTITDHTDDIGLGMDVNSSGELVATPSKDKTVKVWQVIKE